MLFALGGWPHDFAVSVASARGRLQGNVEGSATSGARHMAGRAQMDSGERRKRKAELDKAELDAELDRALAQTFPASDPYSVGQFASRRPRPCRPGARGDPASHPTDNRQLT